MKRRLAVLIATAFAVGACHRNTTSSSPGDVAPATAPKPPVRPDTQSVGSPSAARDTAGSSYQKMSDSASTMKPRADTAAAKMRDSTGKIPPTR